MDKIILKANEKGDKYYKKWAKDAKEGLFIVAPLMLLFYSTVWLSIWGFNSKFIFVSIFTAFIISRAFISPYFVRKELINRSIKTISIENEIVSVETFEYLKFPSIHFSFPYKEASFDPLKTNSFFKDQNAWQLTIGPNQEQSFYIVEEFFDASFEPLISTFKK